MVQAIERVQSVMMVHWSDDYANSDHWLNFRNVVSAPSDDVWAEGLIEDRDKLILKDKLWFPKAGWRT